MISTLCNLFFQNRVFTVEWNTFQSDMSNRVEDQERNQPAFEKWSYGFVFGVPLGPRQTQAMIKTKKKGKNNKNNCSSSRSVLLCGLTRFSAVDETLLFQLIELTWPSTDPGRHK